VLCIEECEYLTDALYGLCLNGEVLFMAGVFVDAVQVLNELKEILGVPDVEKFVLLEVV